MGGGSALGSGMALTMLLAVPTARVARKLAPLAPKPPFFTTQHSFGTGLSLLGALPPNPLLSHISGI
jgi:hypothetical protein